MFGVEHFSQLYVETHRLMFYGKSRRVRERMEESFVLKKMPDEFLLQSLWVSGQLGDSFVTLGGEKVKILDYGEWNKSSGPDFLEAHFLIGGQVTIADVVLRGVQTEGREVNKESSLYKNVGLFIFFPVMKEQEALLIQEEEKNLCVSIPLDVLMNVLGQRVFPSSVKGGFCQTPLAGMDDGCLERLMMMAAAYRWGKKQRRFNRVAELFGVDQSLYEAVAETLGYSRNKFAMRQLAQRAPLALLGADVEAILFGVAGFLSPYLPEKSTPSSQSLHKRLWETWWKRRAEFELAEERCILWNMSASRPTNRPERRLAALALIVSKWKDLRPLMLEPSKYAHSLIEVLASLSHAYWSRHVSLPGNPLQNILALVGKERALDLIVNQLLPAEGTKEAWEQYISLHAISCNSHIKIIAEKLFGEKRDYVSYVKYAWQQQALMQLYNDYCLEDSNGEGKFPNQLRQWR